MVVIGAVMLVAGMALGIVYPRYMQALLGPELARWQAYDEAGGFRAETARLFFSDGSTVLTGSLSVRGPLRNAAGRRLVRIAVNDEQDNEVAQIALGFDGGDGALQSPQTGIVRYQEAVPLLGESFGLYTFTPFAGPDFPEEGVVAVELAVNAAENHVDPLARPAGAALGIVGLGAMLLGLRRRRANPNEQPPRWGRR